MNANNELRFAVSDRIRDVEVDPAHVPLALLGEFQKDVSEFLKGSGHDIDPAHVQISVEQGSLAFVASGLLAATSLWADLAHLKSSGSLELMDVKRAAVVERWQGVAYKNPMRRYVVADRADQLGFTVDSTSNYRRVEPIWVQVEKYLYGKIVDLGGKTKANVHLALENGDTITIAAQKSLLEQEEYNHLYRFASLHVTAEENLLTGALRNVNLLAFEPYQPSYHEEDFRLMVSRGTRAWADVSDQTSWLESLRGGKA
ncbi:MAG: hypothetical protein PHI11_04245 [Gallionella sp.]|nr:hypothetical protein [Gallionella sp.]